MSGSGRERRPVAHHGIAPSPACSPDQACALCGDVAVPTRVIALDLVTGTGTVEPVAGSTASAVGTAGAGSAAAGSGAAGRLTVALDLVDGVSVGDIVLVHQGFAIERVREP
jgi:hypothetical protein